MSESEEKSVEEILSKAKVLVATPCFAGLCSAEYMTSMSRLAALASTYKIDISLVTGRNESLITRARNNLASEFLSIPEATHLMFIDSDIGFDPNDVPDPTDIENLERPCGRGLMLMRHYMTEVNYNAIGNSVRMKKVFKKA